MYKNVINQKGLSSILFAMIFATVLSLLAIGFATLMRNDQRQVLDQSLGFQAEYAAETAVNQVQAAIASGPLSPSESNGCSKAFSVESGSGAEVTCVNWTDKAPNIIVQNVGINSESFKLETSSGTFDTFDITWTVKDVPNDGDPLTSNDGLYSNDKELPKKIESSLGTDSKYPILRVAMYGGGVFKQFYFVPTDASSSNGTFNGGDYSGQVFNASCSGTVCDATITGVSGLTGGYLAVSVLGQPALSVTITDNGGKVFEGAQYVIDATAIAQDVTKRVEARVPATTGNSWRAGGAIGVNSMCKDMKIDGTNNTTASGATADCN